jgi:Spy/CpxP family protein refolding chaperone
MKLKRTAIAAAIALGVIGVTAYAHGYGPGMMGGYGGYGMGPGMMGGYGGYGMGPGMMGGAGGFHGYGMGPGMMGMGGVNFAVLDSLGLSEQQRKQISSIQDTLYKDNQELMTRMHDEMWKFRDSSSASGERDWDALLAASRRMSSLRQQMFENSIAAARKTETLLTPEQRKQYARLGGACRFDDDE